MIYEYLRAMQSAGQWYKQNRKLKRQSAALLQKLPPQTIQEWDTMDAVDTGILTLTSLVCLKNPKVKLMHEYFCD